jgi:hypothetical protein
MFARQRDPLGREIHVDEQSHATAMAKGTPQLLDALGSAGKCFADPFDYRTESGQLCVGLGHLPAR